MDGCLSYGAIGSFFLTCREDESTFIEKFELDSNMGWEEWSRSTQACTHHLVRTMKGAGLQFRSVMPSTAQLIHRLWAHADEFIHICSLSENFQAKLPDCSVLQPKYTTSLICLLGCIALLSGGRRVVPCWKNRQNEGLLSKRKA